MRRNLKDTLGQSGAFAMIFALLLIPLIGFLGLAIDSSRGYAVKHRLQEVIDAAALAGARNFDSADRDYIIRQYFASNWKQGFYATHHVDINNDVVIVPDLTNRTISVTANVTMDTLIMPAVGGQPTIQIGSLNTAYKDISFVELALALDTTTSMRLGTGASASVQPANPHHRRINIMKDAAIDFVNGLYTQGATVVDHTDNLRVSLIPFTSMVNVGNQHTEFLATGSLTGLTWDYPKNATSQNQWRGCLFERSFYSNLANGGTYPGRDLTDDNPSVEAFYPYNVAAPHFESLAICNGPPPTPTPVPTPTPTPTPTPIIVPTPTPSPTPTPTPPPTPPPCTDGVCSTSLRGLPILTRSDAAEQVAFRLNETGARDEGRFDAIQTVAFGTVSGTCEYYGQSPSWWSGYNQYVPAYAVQSVDGIWVDAPSPDGVHTRSCFPGTSSPFSGNCNSVNKYSMYNPAVCCTGGYMGYNQLSWTYNGRWIHPWPNSVNPKLGGWGNSGCGAPLIPLSDDRLAIINAINDLDVPLERPAVQGPDMGYSGTLINQGLVWAWRTISPNWRGWWEDSSGSPIDATLPRDYGSTGSSKVVVVMTDGLNFLPDRDARVAYGYNQALMFGKASVFAHSSNTAATAAPTSVSWPKPSETNLHNAYNGSVSWTDVDSSAYGVMHGYNKHGLDGVQAQMSFCTKRQTGGYETSLTAGMGCRPFACMIRDASGACLSSNVNTWSPTVADALTGPYYNELLSRLVTTCTNMRAQGVRVFFILFALDDNPQKATAMAALNSCVGASGRVYDASDAAELSSSFADILARVRRLSLQE